MASDIRRSGCEPVPKGLIIQSPAFFFDKRPAAFGLEHAVFGSGRAFGGLAAQFLPGLAGRVGRLAFALLERGEQAFPGELAVNGLGAGILDRHRQVGGQMAQGDAGGNLVHVLPARPGRTAENLLQFGLIQRGYFHK